MVIGIGRTSYSSNAFAVALTSIDFIYFPSMLGTSATSNFDANN